MGAGEVFDGCVDDKNGPECIAQKLNGDLKLPKAIAQRMQKEMAKADKEGRPMSEMRTEFIDAMFGLYTQMNKNDPAGVAAGTAPFDLSKVTMADVKAASAAPRAGTALAQGSLLSN